MPESLSESTIPALDTAGLYRVAFMVTRMATVFVRLPESLASALRNDLAAAMAWDIRPDPSRLGEQLQALQVTAVSPLLLSPNEFLTAAEDQVIDPFADSEDEAERQLRESFSRHFDEAARLNMALRQTKPADYQVFEWCFVRDFGGAPDNTLEAFRLVAPDQSGATRRWINKVKAALEKPGYVMGGPLTPITAETVVHDHLQDALNDLSQQLARTDKDHPWVQWLREGVPVAQALGRDRAAQDQVPVGKRLRRRS